MSLPLHIDSLVPYLSSQVFSMQYSIILEDQGESNDCTVVVRGSHLSNQYAPQESLRDAVPIHSKKGDVVIWDSRLWHGLLANTSGCTRWAMIVTFTRWWVKQCFDLTGSLPSHIFQALTDSQKASMGYCSLPFESEAQGIEIKVGYDALPQRAKAA